MDGLASVGLIERIVKSGEEVRAELRVAETGDFVAWFHTNVRISATERVVSKSTQFVQRHRLTLEQIQAVQKWMHKRMCERK